mmetsp:Transcript_369/g.837  ORF Transcript_369/g.837 Transcript_369/m.837 type:complete len:549 (-) Transcript_369:139-1785(-)|eukprot:CAMPEP_0116138956 /NCGR_PEP_ID=MMETSP0329-20121206/13048_1 /TAXON_ID=697910 /ORGANISM="Pseudo-nitzschia arenysensis, Strain B593" /LENGTH=548 /DNA_ID=CAMNT_0003633953 /DNA_START=139 /DNA_END=1785 /DNA_ORIENTATION=+
MTKTFEHNFNQTSQYSEDTIKQFEATFGKNYMSAGGYETSLEMAKLLAPVLKRSGDAPKVLDIGCGIGGSAFFFATEYGANVHGLDINDVGIQMAKRELEANPLPRGECKFETLDATSDSCNFEPETFDVIYSRDTVLHMDHKCKIALFSKFKTWLKPGGMICICDYCLGPRSANGISADFQNYLNTRGYHLLSPDGWEKTFADIGFDEEMVVARDCALWYCQICRKEVDRVVVPGEGRQVFLANKNEDDIMKLEKVYGDKINMTLRGDRSYVMVTATKTPKLMNARKEVSDAYKLVSAKNMIMSCDGNVSRRVDENSFLITPSGVEIHDLEAKKIVHCDMNGYSMPGEEYKPSSEFQLHAAIYRARPDVGAIVHTHGIYSCALACCRVPLPPAHYAVCELLGPIDFSDPNGGSTISKKPFIEDATIKCANYHTYGSKHLAEVTSNGLGKNHAVLMGNHGAVVVGPDMDMAMYNAERLERECEIYWRCLQMKAVGVPQTLTMNEIKDLHRADETYGQDHPQEKGAATEDNSLGSMTSSDVSSISGTEE